MLPAFAEKIGQGLRIDSVTIKIFGYLIVSGTQRERENHKKGRTQ